jgi:acyl transferase domain-containing protein
MSVNLPENEARDYFRSKGLAYLSDSVHIACVNSPSNITLSGGSESINALYRCLLDDGIFAKILTTGIGYHSPAMQQITSDYRSRIGSLEPGNLAGREATSMISSVNGEIVTSLAFADYWVDNLSFPVRFLDALDTLLQQKSLSSLASNSRHDFVEVGPQGALRYPVLETMKNRAFGAAAERYFAVLKKIAVPQQTLLECVGNLFCRGHPVSVWAANNVDAESKQVTLLPDCPAYPFDHSKKYWAEPRLSHEYRMRTAAGAGILGPRFYDHPHELRWRTFLNTKDMPWVKDHVVSENNPDNNLKAN